MARSLLRSQWVLRPALGRAPRARIGFEMTPRAGWWAWAAILALVAAGAAAAPVDCLTLRDNSRVAACANQYGQAAPARARPATAPPVATGIPAAAESDLKSVPVVVAVKTAPVAPPPAPEAPMFTVDRQVLTNTIIVGALAGSLLILVALGFWRWGSTLVKDCPWCASKISRSAQTCPHCFRQL